MIQKTVGVPIRYLDFSGRLKVSCTLLLKKRSRLKFPIITVVLWHDSSGIYRVSAIVMPLWSNEEWRACIGSSWCALGRLVKNKSPITASSHRSVRYKAQGLVTMWFRTTLQAILVISTLLWKRNITVTTRSTGCRGKSINFITDTTAL